MRSIERFPRFGFLLLLAVSMRSGMLHAQATGSPSFGNILMPAKHVTLRRALAPAFNANGHSVAVITEPGVNSQLAEQLQSGLQGFLTSTSSNVRVEREHTDVVIQCKPISFTAPHVVNDSTNGMQTSTLAGSLEVQFQITLTGSGRVLAADRYMGDASQELSQTTQAGPSKTRSLLGIKTQTGGPVTKKDSNETPQQMQDNLAQGAARYIASYLVSTPQEVEVTLAGGGSLNEADKLAEAGLWSRDLETLESMGPYASPHADAFRLYDMGVANEALGYATQDLTAAMKYLSEASNDYGKSMDAVPDNRQFIASQNRIKAALVQVTARAGIAKGGTVQQASIPEQHAAAAAASDPPLTDSDVMQMVGAHLDEANIIDTIQHAGHVQFDLTVPAQVKLTHAGVDGRVLMAMKARARSGTGAQ